MKWKKVLHGYYKTPGSEFWAFIERVGKKAWEMRVWTEGGAGSPHLVATYPTMREAKENAEEVLVTMSGDAYAKHLGLVA